MDEGGWRWCWKVDSGGGGGWWMNEGGRGSAGRWVVMVGGSCGGW